MKLQVKEQLKVLLVQENIMLKELAVMISEKTGKKYTSNSLSQKLRRGTLSYNETLIIADILGYEIEFNKK